MNLKPLFAAAILAGSPAIALAQTTAPVAIVNSQAQPQIQDVGGGNSAGFADVTFVNHNNVPATEIDFTLSSNGTALETLTDKGTFSPGVAVSHSFTTAQTERDLQISVAEVKFADGTSWVNDGPLPQGQRAVHDWMSEPLSGS
jgi:hypothetical protein